MTKHCNRFNPKRTNIIIDLDNNTIHLIDKLEELNDWIIEDVKEREFNIVTWKCRRGKT